MRFLKGTFDALQSDYTQILASRRSGANYTYQRKRRHKFTNRFIAFGKKARIERHRTLETGLNASSRELFSELSDCSVRLQRYEGDVPLKLGDRLLLSS